MRLMSVGFPKSGSTSLTVALRESGLRTAHWAIEKEQLVGSLIYRAVFRGLEPFAYLAEYDAITQADACIPQLGINHWPNLDFAILAAIRRAHPECLFLLNTRDPELIAQSMCRWPGMQRRLVFADIPGLPAGLGEKPHLIRWIENHYAACRSFFASDPNFVEIDIAGDVPGLLSERLGIPIVGWGDHKPEVRPPLSAQALSFRVPS